MRTLGRASICSPMSGDNGVDAGDPAEHVREQELVMVGELPVERSAQLILLLLYLCFTWIGGVGLRYGSTADQGRTGRKDSSSRLWRPAPAPGTHAKRGPSTGHSAVGLRQGGEMSPDAEATFHCASCTLGNQVFVLRTALLFVRSAVRLVSAELPGPVAVCSPKRALCELGDRVLGGDRIVEHRPPACAAAPTAHCPTEPPPPRSTRPDPKQTPAPSCNLGGGPTDVRILVAARRRGLSSGCPTRM